MIYQFDPHFDNSHPPFTDVITADVAAGHMIIIPPTEERRYAYAKICVEMPNNKPYFIFTPMPEQCICDARDRRLTEDEVIEAQRLLMAASILGENTDTYRITIRCKAPDHNLYAGSIPHWKRLKLAKNTTWTGGLEEGDRLCKAGLPEVSGNRMRLKDGSSLFFWADTDYDDIDPLHLVVYKHQPYILNEALFEELRNWGAKIAEERAEQRAKRKKSKHPTSTNADND